MAVTGWRACLPMNMAEAKPSSSHLCSKAKPSKHHCWSKSGASPAPALTKSYKHLPCASLPKCPYFGECGGCHYQHTGYAHQLEIKAAILKENLRRISKIELDTELIRPSFVRNGTTGTAPGCRSGSSLSSRSAITDLIRTKCCRSKQCPISSPLINRAIAAIWQMGRAGKMGKGIQEIEFFANAEDSKLLLQLHATDIRRQAAIQIVEEIKSALPEVAGISLRRNLPATVPNRNKS